MSSFPYSIPTVFNATNPNLSGSKYDTAFNSNLEPMLRYGVGGAQGATTTVNTPTAANGTQVPPSPEQPRNQNQSTGDFVETFMMRLLSPEFQRQQTEDKLKLLRTESELDEARSVRDAERIEKIMLERAKQQQRLGKESRLFDFYTNKLPEMVSAPARIYNDIMSYAPSTLAANPRTFNALGGGNYRLGI